MRSGLGKLASDLFLFFLLTIFLPFLSLVNQPYSFISIFELNLRPDLGYQYL